MSATGERRAGEDGFTLMEALVAFAILGLITGLVFPAVARGLGGLAFQEAAAGLRADLAMARDQALRTGDPVALVVDDSGGGYGWTPGPQRALIAGVRLAPRGGLVRFYPDGSSSGGLFALSGGRRTVRLAVTPGLGVAETLP
jgi:general secretion pathway protein H